MYEKKYDVDFKDLLTTALFCAVAFPVGIALILAPLVFFVRAAAYLVTGDWIWSACDVLNHLGTVLPEWRLRDPSCSIQTGFLGFDGIATFAVSGVDASLGLLIAAGCLVMAMIGIAFFALFVKGAMGG